ncbi:clpA ATP-binding subunit of Clp protease and DnaK/DnaJ chaperone [Pyrenophora tritici-repentis]|nr:clpA ATP-binding subunit of Clp protease and DnaK/DnaJ chaperone [Pyrenophora tritici-repentis]
MTFPNIDNDKFVLLPLELPLDRLFDTDARDSSIDDRLSRLGSPTSFSIKTLCAAIYNKCTVNAIKSYIHSYQASTKATKLLSNDGWPALYYAIGRNSCDLIAVLLQHGVDAISSNNTFCIPLIAYAIIYGHIEAIDTSEIVKLLLAAGCNPTTIPMDMWCKYLNTPTKTADLSIKVPADAQRSSVWCNPRTRSILARSMHLTHRYVLHLAHELAPLRLRMLQIAKAHKITELTKLPYFLIGQRPAADIVMKRVHSHVSLGSKAPLVMAFAGPSGHGKTELAKAMGDLLSVKHTIIDMAGCHDVFDLFGSPAGYHRSLDGSKLNNFLAANSGKRSVVFLDEFDKSNQSIRNALLLLTHSGDYQDRRSNTAVDCKKTIWIVATNFGDDVICSYHAKHLERLDEKKNAADLTILQATLKHEYKIKFGAPFTGRINLIVPFLPFTKSECAVVLHKFMLAFATNIRQPIDLQADVNRLVGHCRLSLVEDGNVCITLTERYYNQDLGARSLKNAVEEVEHLFSTQYNNIETPITEEINTGPLQHFILNRISIADDEYDVVVSAGDIDFDLDGEANEGSKGTLQHDEAEGRAKQASSPGPLFSAVRSGQQQPNHTVIIAPERIHGLAIFCELALIKRKPYKAQIPVFGVTICSVSRNPRSRATLYEAHPAYSLLPPVLTTIERINAWLRNSANPESDAEVALSHSRPSKRRRHSDLCTRPIERSRPHSPSKQPCVERDEPITPLKARQWWAAGRGGGIGCCPGVGSRQSRV